MKVEAIKTGIVSPRKKESLNHLLDKSLSSLQEDSILAITSKVVSICEGMFILDRPDLKERMIAREAQYYLPKSSSKFQTMLTINKSILIPSAGIDESNGDGYLILWPVDPQRSANMVREYLRKRFGLKKVGVIITDSHTTPLRWGVTGIGLAHSGFKAINNFIGKTDLFGKKLSMTKANVLDGLASAAVLIMGESVEQTPLAVISEVPSIVFQSRNPSARELREMNISIDDDLYAPLLQAVDWKKGRKQI